MNGDFSVNSSLLGRQMLALRHIEGLKSSEVAALLEINQSTASTRYLRALNKLKDGLANTI